FRGAGFWPWGFGSGFRGAGFWPWGFGSGFRGAGSGFSGKDSGTMPFGCPPADTVFFSSGAMTGTCPISRLLLKADLAKSPATNAAARSMPAEN
ncbi:MAG: hypothetical protein LBQ79_03510, partial [Deltaproteobacteria bacterium]|nr:hypothetical protein [Deltaproteobacteria bacterium]